MPVKKWWCKHVKERSVFKLPVRQFCSFCRKSLQKLKFILNVYSEPMLKVNTYTCYHYRKLQETSDLSLEISQSRERKSRLKQWLYAEFRQVPGMSKGSTNDELFRSVANIHFLVMCHNKISVQSLL
jgi:hypothetical protein